MAYTETNYQNKDALLNDFKAGKNIRVFQPGKFGPDVADGDVLIEGPHYPQPHSWYAYVEVEGGIIKRFKVNE